MKTKRIIILSVIGLATLGGSFAWYRKTHVPVMTKYVLSAVSRGTLAVTVTGSGQVSSDDQIDIKPKVSGELLSVNVKAGQVVKAGDVIARIDAKDALKAVRDAKNNLETAQLSLDKLQQPADTLTLMQSQNALTQARTALTQAQDALAKDYQDGYASVAQTLRDLPDVMQGMQSLLYTSTLDKNGGRWNIDWYGDGLAKYDENSLTYKTEATTAFSTARDAYNKTLNSYKTVSASSDPQTIENLISQMSDTVVKIDAAVKSTTGFIARYTDKLTQYNLPISSAVAVHQSLLRNYASTLSGEESNLLGAATSISNDKRSITSNEESIAERTESLKKTQAGPDTLDVRSQNLTIQQRQEALTDAQISLADYTVRAPFDGVIAKVGAKTHDTASSGSALVTLVSPNQNAQISLNEVDAAKIKAGQKATLTFDAVSDLTLSGQVADVDALGTVSQGVVTYGAKIVFDVQDDRVKSGMTVSASIITDAHPDVVLVPSSAVKGTAGSQYVETIDGASAGAQVEGTPRRIPVTIGLTNDDSAEITEGLKEGDLIITRTVTTGGKTTAAAAPSLFGAAGGARGAGGVGGNATFRAAVPAGR